MGFKIFQQLAFTAFVLIVGQLQVKNQTIGAHFIGGIRDAGVWAVSEIKRARLFNDAMEIKAAIEKKKGGAKAVHASVAEKFETAKEMVDGAHKKLQTAREEVQAQAMKNQEELSDDSDELDEPELSLGTPDQEAIIKNLP